MNIQDKVLKILYEKQDLKYRKFHSSLVPDIKNFIGVRLPDMRAAAKKIAAECAEEYINTMPEDASYEQIMIEGLVIGYYKCSDEEKLVLVRSFVPKINNWAVCDSFCSSLKFVRKNKDEMLEYIKQCIKSRREFEIRFGIVMLLDYYVEEKYINEIFETADKIKSSAYYVKMALAWCISVCYVKFPELTAEYLENSRLCDFTYNKAISKITDSYRVSKEEKEKIRKMRRVQPGKQ